MSDKITLDRETFKALAADTRVDILKKLGEHKENLKKKVLQGDAKVQAELDKPAKK